MSGPRVKGELIARDVEENYSESDGVTTTFEYVDLKPRLLALYNDARFCGFIRATLRPLKPGDVNYVLRLTYAGRNIAEARNFTPQPEQQTSHWGVSASYADLDLWRHPKFEPLIECQIGFGDLVLEKVNPAIPDPEIVAWSFAGPWPNLPGTIAAATVAAKNYVKNFEASLTTNERYPYSRMVQTAAETWRGAIQEQMQTNFRNILLRKPVEGVLQAVRDEDGDRFVNLTEQFNVLRHMVSQKEEGGSAFAIIPWRSRLDPSGRVWPPERLIAMANFFAEEILAGRNTFPYDFQRIINTRIVGARHGLGLDHLGVNEVWTSAYVAEAIRVQLEQRRIERRSTPLSCLKDDYTFLNIIQLLNGPLRNRLWLKQAPSTEIVARGRIEVTTEFIERLPWQLNSFVNPLYRGGIPNPLAPSVPVAPGPGIQPPTDDFIPPGIRP